MAATFMWYFYIGANLRWLMNATKWPNALSYSKMIAAYQQAVASVSLRGVNVADFVPFENDANGANTHAAIYDEKKEVELNPDVYDALLRLLRLDRLHTKGHHISSIDRDGMTFATRSAGKRNSFVLFSTPLSPSPDLFPCAGQISDIFLHGRRVNGQTIFEPFFLIYEFSPLAPADARRDPYRVYDDLETRMFYNIFQPTPRLVRLEDIKCHFASLLYDMDLVKVFKRSLLRPRLSALRPTFTLHLSPAPAHSASRLSLHSTASRMLHLSRVLRLRLSRPPACSASLASVPFHLSAASPSHLSALHMIHTCSPRSRHAQPLACSGLLRLATIHPSSAPPRSACSTSHLLQPAPPAFHLHAPPRSRPPLTPAHLVLATLSLPHAPACSASPRSTPHLRTSPLAPLCVLHLSPAPAYSACVPSPCSASFAPHLVLGTRLSHAPACSASPRSTPRLRLPALRVPPIRTSGNHLFA
ncbi:hypothetical protein LXA43DRAFT_1102994 [Ganoderma leucocontextum]|nr:hypothetical protein LXA43DRAFT_1102994 [Ganoderma leucocontextum]